MPREQIAAGGADILAHVMERYFSSTQGNELSDSLCEGAMQPLMKVLPCVLQNTDDMNAWEQLMWTGNVAHNGLLGKGNNEDWASHEIEHELSVMYDIAHGAGLAVTLSAWMQYTHRENMQKFLRFAVRAMEVQDALEESMAEEAITHLKQFFNSLGLVTNLSVIGIGDEHFADMTQKACKGGTLGAFRILTPKDVEAIYRIAL